jgi:Zn-dependent protease with chaperone function
MFKRLTKIQFYFSYFLYVFVFISITLWVTIALWGSSLGKQKKPVTILSDKNISILIKQKTGIIIESVTIAESDRPFAMMVGIPSKPQLVLSRYLYSTFSPVALEYVLLHEAGHYVLWHSVIETLAGITFLILGIMLLKRIHHGCRLYVTAVLLGVFFAVFMIRLGRIHEYNADGYTLKHISNPKGMIEATENFKTYYGMNFTENHNPILQWLFYRSNPFENRIEMAEREINRRN